MLFKEDGAVMTNRTSLITCTEVIRSDVILRQTVDSLALADRWKIEKEDAIDRLRKSLQLSRNIHNGTVTIALNAIPDDEKAAIINALCDQIALIVNARSPTPVQQPQGFDPSKFPVDVFHSTSAVPVEIEAEILTRAIR
jgi:capsular polysaccharide biosynthesis protein